MAEILNYVDIDQQLNSIYNYKQHPITSASMVISSSILGVNDKGFAVYNIDDNSPYWWDGVEFKTFPTSSGGYIDTSSLVLTSSFNNFTSSYNTGSFTGSFYGNGQGLEINKIISGSVSASISYDSGLEINTDIKATSFQTYDEVTQQWIVFSSFENGFNITYQDGTNLIFAQDGEFSIGDISNNDMATVRNILLTENRVYDYPDKDGVIALLSDILNITGSFVTTSSFNNFVTFYNTGSFTGSFIGDGSQLINLPTSSVDTSSFILNSQTSSMSVSSSLYSISSSYSSTASYYNETDPIFVSKSGSYATTGSNTFNGNQVISGALDVTNSITGSLFGTSSWASSAISSSYSLSSSFALTSSYIPGGDVWSMTITTTSSVDTNTTGSSGYDQNGRHTKISNGANVINWTVQTSSHSDFIASYEKIGSSNITFVAGSGATLVLLSGTALLSGAVGSKACLSRNGNTYYLQITNY